jgi:SMC interacting uncharacterized protein involved in chromosome segregation
VGVIMSATQASSIKHQASSIKHQASSIKHQASSIKHQAALRDQSVHQKVNEGIRNHILNLDGEFYQQYLGANTWRKPTKRKDVLVWNLFHVLFINP